MQVYFAAEIYGDTITLDREESHHLVHVLRHRSGDEILITNGKGIMALAEISIPDAKGCVVKILSYPDRYKKHLYHLHMAVAPTKNIDRFEWFLEKAIEIGIDEITPLITRRSERKVVNAERLNKLLLAAAKQSLKASFPILHPLTSYADIISSKIEGQKFIALCEEDLPSLKSTYSQGSAAIILIGPEGDFEEEEVKLAFAAGFKGISLGKSRLRTETAALVACQSVAFMNQ
ncbi:MAG: 16S rRNA (uracil(1498)-N(3))-methyltransferase [Bacteroidota bacterium]